MPAKIPRRASQALLHSLSAGVVPRIGLEHVAVGREDEVTALRGDLENVAQGGAAFRLILGRYGTGKTFLLRLISNYALQTNFVVADADLSPERRLAGSSNQGLATYRELVRNLATKARPDGGALASLMERWISNVQAKVARDGVQLDSPNFQLAVEAKIIDVAREMRELVNGFDFAKVIIAYWRGYRLDDDSLKESALRWLRGEYTTKTEARTALGVRVIIDDNNWYDHLKLLAHFVSQVEYKGLVVMIDEAVNLYQIGNSSSRENNYEKLLTIFNDTMQGNAEHIGFLLGGTPQFLEDPRRGLYSYEALRSRLSETRFAKNGWRDTSSPVLRLQTLTHEEIYVLLQHLAEVHTAHHQASYQLFPADYRLFMQEALNRVGSDAFLAPRDLIRDFLSILNIMQQRPGVSVTQVIHGPDFTPSTEDRSTEVEADEYAEFTL